MGFVVLTVLADVSVHFMVDAGATDGRRIEVGDARSLAKAVAEARPGTTIILKPGVYEIDRAIRIEAPGLEGQPITLRAERLGDAVLESRTVEAFKVFAPFWRFEGLDIVGVCADHSTCEHAFHIVGAADFTVVAGNRLRDFNAQIKGNGEAVDEQRRFPDHVLIEGNAIFNSTPRDTDNPVAAIDVVGGANWIVRDNVIHDFAKAGGDQVSYGAFLKGNSRDGVFERNVVLCAWRHDGGIRVGLSFGGGGTGARFCAGDCAQEHLGGIMRNNVVAFCSDAGIHLNKARAVSVHNNTLYKTRGIEVRFAESEADVRNNALTGAIRARDGGAVTAAANLVGGVADFRRWFADPDRLDFRAVDGARLVDRGDAGAIMVDDDVCGRSRAGRLPDIGAFEYGAGAPCDLAARVDVP